MTTTRTLILFITNFLLCSCHSTHDPAPAKLRIWFREPATIWEAALPLGNGKTSMMPDGNVTNETIVLNDITLWSGGVQDPDNPEAAKYLPEIRKLLFKGKNDETQELIFKTFVCKGSGSGYGNGTRVPYGSYEVLGTMHLEFDLDSMTKPGNYSRQLSLDDAIASCNFHHKGVAYSLYRRQVILNLFKNLIINDLKFRSRLRRDGMTLKRTLETASFLHVKKLTNKAIFKRVTNPPIV